MKVTELLVLIVETIKDKNYGETPTTGDELQSVLTTMVNTIVANSGKEFGEYKPAETYTSKMCFVYQGVIYQVKNGATMTGAFDSALCNNLFEGLGGGEGTAVINDLITGGALVALSAQQGVVLKGLVDSLTSLLTSNDTTLDELQEIVDYIKTNRADLDALSISSILGLQTALDGKAHVGLSNLIYSINSTDGGINYTVEVNFANLGYAIAMFQSPDTNTGALTITQPNGNVISIVDADGNALVGGEISPGRIYLTTLYATNMYRMVHSTNAPGSDENLYNTDGTITDTERIVSIPASRNIVFQGVSAITNIGTDGFESTSQDGSGNETALENRNGVLVHRSDLNKPIKSLAYYAPTSDEDYAQKKYVTDSITAAVNALVAGAPGALDTLLELSDSLGNDANFATTVTNALAKKEGKLASTTVTASFASLSPNSTCTTGLALTTHPSLITVNFANQNNSASTPTINPDGLGAKTLIDARTGLTFAQNTVPNGKTLHLIYTGTAYYVFGLAPDITHKDLWCLATTANNGASFTATITDYNSTSKPRLISVRLFSSLYTGVSGSSTINFNGLGATPMVNQFGEALLPSDLQSGRNYILSYQSTSNVYFVHETGVKLLGDNNYWLRSQFCGSGAIGIPYLTSASINGGSIPNTGTLKFKFPFGHTIRSGAGGNSGYRHYTYNFGTSDVMFGGMAGQIFFALPTVDLTTRLMQFGNVSAVVIPGSQIDAFYLEVNNLTLSAKSVASGAMTTHVTTYTLTKGIMYRMLIEVDNTNSTISYYLYEFGSSTPVWSVAIATNIPSTVLGMQWSFSAINTAAAVADIVHIYELGHGTKSGREKLS